MGLSHTERRRRGCDVVNFLLQQLLQFVLGQVVVQNTAVLAVELGVASFREMCSSVDRRSDRGASALSQNWGITEDTLCVGHFGCHDFASNSSQLIRDYHLECFCQPIPRRHCENALGGLEANSHRNMITNIFLLLYGSTKPLNYVRLLRPVSRFRNDAPCVGSVFVSKNVGVQEIEPLPTTIKYFFTSFHPCRPFPYHQLHHDHAYVHLQGHQ